MILKRFAYLDDATLGKLTVEGGERFWTIERPWIDNLHNVSCIPEGRYKLIPHSGAKFQNVVELVDVPGRTAILIHAANLATDIEGCVAPGISFMLCPQRRVVASQAALGRILAAFDRGDHEIIIGAASARLEVKDGG